MRPIGERPRLPLRVLILLSIPLLARAASAQSRADFLPVGQQRLAIYARDVQEPGTWGCTEASVDRPTSLPATTAAGTTPIPPRGLDEDLAELRLGQPFPRVKPHNLSLTPEQVPGAEREFCSRDPELACAGVAARERLVADLMKRVTRIASNPSLSAVARVATAHLLADLSHGTVPVVLFTTAIQAGPTAAAIRYRDPTSGRWILGIAFARDFVSSADNQLFLDGVVLQEIVHYDDVAFLPDPFRCYESDMEIRGHEAMIAYWKTFRTDPRTTHPRIQLALTAGLNDASTRTQWYRYLNQAERTDFRVQDLLVSLEFRTLPALSPDPIDDTRFLTQLSEVVSSALTRAGNLRRSVARLPSDSINGDARVISAVADLVPRVLLRYGHTRGNLRGPDGVARETVMASRLNAIQLSLDALGSLMGVLAADPDFRRKSDFGGRP